MKKNAQLIGLVCLWLFLPFHCTTLLVASRIKSDTSINSMAQFPNENIYHISRGTRIQIRTRLGDILEGRLLKIIPEYNDRYADIYSDNLTLQISSEIVPRINDPLQITTGPNKIVTGQFLGFDYKKICIKIPDRNENSIIDFSRIASVNLANGKSISIPSIRYLIDQNEIPIISVMYLKSSGKEIILSVNDIQGITVKLNWFKSLGSIAGSICIDYFLISTLSRIRND